MRYAGVLVRGCALGVDLALFCAVFFPVTRIVKGVWLMQPDDHRWVSGWFIFDPLCLVFLGVIIGTYVTAEALWCGTPGKLLLGLRVVDATGNRPGWRRALLRTLGRLVDGLPAFNLLGIALILTSPDRRRFGDRIAGTWVVHARS